jgi:hypothetical protein
MVVLSLDCESLFMARHRNGGVDFVDRSVLEIGSIL